MYILIIRMEFCAHRARSNIAVDYIMHNDIGKPFDSSNKWC